MSKAGHPDESITKKELSIIFIHLDLGIGGAEQLVVNLAIASLTTKDSDTNQNISIYTTNCDQSHCFDEVNKSKNGILSNCVYLRGTFFPDELRIPFTNKSIGGRAICSSVRILYLSFCAALECLTLKKKKTKFLFVVDILPTSLPLLQLMVYLLSPIYSIAGVLFYCHFPDKHLVRDTINGEENRSQKRSKLRIIYRRVLDYIEERTMAFADFVLVNSKFTKEVVEESFPRFPSFGIPISVLYPAINLDKFVPPAQEEIHMIETKLGPIVSLNRFERKKNIELLLFSIAKLKENNLSHELEDQLKVVIAGGYDSRNDENKEYLIELKKISKDLRIDSHITFAPSISDSERASLLQTSLCVCYTPHREHFGIVPLEAMYAGSPVIAINSGGPKETVINNVTGKLVLNSPDAFANAIYEMIIDPKRAREMGRNGHSRVKHGFGIEKFRLEWLTIIDDALNESITNYKAKQSRAQIMLLALNILFAILAIAVCKIYHL